MIAAGELDRRVTIQRGPTGAADTSGRKDRTWADLVGRWAKITPLSGSELFEAQQVVGEASIRITLRGDPVTRAMDKASYRIKIGNRVLPILHILDVEQRGVRLELLCKESQ